MDQIWRQLGKDGRPTVKYECEFGEINNDKTHVRALGPIPCHGAVTENRKFVKVYNVSTIFVCKTLMHHAFKNCLPLMLTKISKGSKDLFNL